MNFKILFPLISAILAGFYFVSSELFIRSFGDLSLIMVIIVNLSGGLFLLSLTKDKIIKLKKISTKDYWLIILGSFFAFGLSYFFLYKSINLIGSSKASFLDQSEYIFIIILSIIFLKEKLHLKALIGLIVIFLGAVIINFDASLLTLIFSTGEAYVVLTALMFAIGIVIISNLIKKYDTQTITSLEMTFGGLILCLFLFLNPINFKFAHLLFLVPLGFLLSIIWYTYNKGIKLIGVSITSIIYSTKSFFILVFSIITVNIVPTSNIIIPKNLLFLIIGGFLIFIGIVVLEKDKKLSKAE